MKHRYHAPAIILCCAMLAACAIPASADDSCPVAKELARKSMELFETDQKKGLSGLVQAHKLCPDFPEISYNLGLAYYRYRRPDLAYKLWAELAEKQSDDVALTTNVGWLALELDKLDEAEKHAQTVLARSANDSRALALRLEVLFRRGEYADALRFAMQHRAQVPDATIGNAVEYAIEQNWNRFRTGDKNDALKSVMELAGAYPNVAAFAEAKDKMLLALIDDTADIPLPKPLPDQQRSATVIAAAPESEVLNIADLEPTLTPTDDAYALIVGISDYQHLNGPRFSSRDAMQVHRLITRLGGFKNDTAHIRLRTDREATIGTLYNDVRWLVQKAKRYPKAKILFYFSGHGSPVLGEDNTTIRDGLLVPYEATMDSLDERASLSLGYLKKEFAQLDNREVLALVDACFSGTGKSVSRHKLAVPKVDRSLLDSEKLFISASAADRPAEEYEPGQQGAFSYFFLEGLMGKADGDGDHWVDTAEAFGYARDKLEALGYEQNPQMNRPIRVKLSRTP